MDSFPPPSGPVASSLGLVVYLRFTKVCRGFITVSAAFRTVHGGFQEGLQRVVEGLCKMTTKLILDCDYF